MVNAKWKSTDKDGIITTANSEDIYSNEQAYTVHTHTAACEWAGCVMSWCSTRRYGIQD